MDRLLQIGFREIGRWALAENGLQLQLDALQAHRRALYAFATETQVLYVGKTAGTLATRLQAYVAPHQSQRTNVRNRAALLELLGAGAQVRILGWIDPGLHRIGPFDLNLAAGLEDGIIALLAPPWNGARMIDVRETTPQVQPAFAAEATRPGLPIASIPDRPALVSTSTAVEAARVPARPASEPARPGASGGDMTFTVRLGKTYYERGFFNVPVMYSKLFGSHGATVDLYCGTERALVHAILDRKANQQSGTPRIYGKSELAFWFQRRFKLDDMLKVTVTSPTTALLT